VSRSSLWTIVKFIWNWSHTKNKKFKAWPTLRKLKESKNADNFLLGTLVMTCTFPTRNYYCCNGTSSNRTTCFFLVRWGIFLKNELGNRSKMYLYRVMVWHAISKIVVNYSYFLKTSVSKSENHMIQHAKNLHEEDQFC
jgi:hypothetical protein